MLPTIWIDSSAKASSGSLGRFRSGASLLVERAASACAPSMRSGRNGATRPSAVQSLGELTEPLLQLALLLAAAGAEQCRRGERERGPARDRPAHFLPPFFAAAWDLRCAATSSSSR